MNLTEEIFIKLARLGSVVFLPTSGGKYLMQQEDNGDLRPPGGGKERVDDDLEDCIIREIHEEFGKTPAETRKTLKLLGLEKRKQFEGNGVFELKDHGLTEKTYQASNHPDEQIKLVECSLDDPRYTGPMPDKLKKSASEEDHHHWRTTYEDCGCTNTCRCSAPKVARTLPGECPLCAAGVKKKASHPDSPFSKYVRKHYKEVGGSDQFQDFVATHNRNDCDSGELHGVSAEEMERIGRLWRAQDKLRKVAHPLDSHVTPKPDNADEVTTPGLVQYNPRTATDPNQHNPADDMIYAHLRDIEDPNARPVPSEHELPIATVKVKSTIKYGSIAVDLDATLAHHDNTKPFRISHIGKPIPKMMARVKQWIKDGEKVVIFTARASDPKNLPPIKAWLKEHGLEGLKVTHEKTPDIAEIWDDKAVSVERNTGKVVKAASAVQPPLLRHKKDTDAVATPPRTGPEAIAYALQHLDLDKKRAEAQSVIDRGLKSKRPLAVETLGFLQGFQRSGLHPKDLMIHAVPVIPPQFRPYTVAGDVFVPGDANELYRDLINLRDIHGELEQKFGPGGAASHKLRVYDAAKALYGFGDPTSPKTKERGVSGFLSALTGTSPKFCYSDDTDILTRRCGWVKFKDLSEDEEVATINPKTFAFEWQKPTAYLHSRYVGQMAHIRVGKQLFKMDLMVTPNHRMWNRPRRRKEKLTEETVVYGWREETAEDTILRGNRTHIMVAAKDWLGNTVLPDCVKAWDPAVFAEFLGWFLAEGNTHVCGTIVQVWQSEANPEYCTELKLLFSKIVAMGIGVHTIVSAPAPDREYVSYGFCLKSQRCLAAWLDINCGRGSGNLRIPRSVLDWDKRHLELLWRSYMKGDGNKRHTYERKTTDCPNHKFRSGLTDGHNGFITTSPGLFDDLAELGFKLGVCVRRRTDHPYLYPDTRAERFAGGVSGRWFCQTESSKYAGFEEYDGHVHCCSVPNGLLVVRRNGAIVVSGNSFIHRKLLSRDQDYVGRGVIGVDPDLGMDEIGIPEEMAWKLYAPYIQRRLVRGGMTPAESVRHIKERGPQADKMMNAEMTERPVLYSRSPAWHKHSVVGGYAKRVNGSGIMINPFVTSGLGADFDGDCGRFYIRIQKYVDTLTAECEAADMINKNSNLRLNEQTIHIQDFPHLDGTNETIAPGVTEYAVPRGTRVYALNRNTWRHEWMPATRFSVHENLEMWQVSLGNSRQIFTSSDHSLVAYKAGKLELVKPAEIQWLCVPRIAKFERRYPVCEHVMVRGEAGKAHVEMEFKLNLNYDIGLWLGLVIGDGCVIDHRQVYLYGTGDKAVNRSRFEQIARSSQLPYTEHIGQASFVSPSLGGGESQRDRSVIGNTSWFSRWLEAQIGHGALNKRIPDFSLNASDTHLWGVLDGLISTDGTICISHGKAKPQLVVAFSTSSVDLVAGMQVLLERLGIRNSVSPYKSKTSGRDAFIISLSTVSLAKRYNENPISFNHPEKNRIFQENIGTVALSGPGVVGDQVPYPDHLHQAFQVAYADRHGRRKNSRGKTDFGTFATFKSKGRWDRSVAQRELNQMKSEGLWSEEFETYQQLVSDTSIAWEQVVEATMLPDRMTGWDITVPGAFTFALDDGVIVQDTCNVHLVSTPDAVEDVKTKLMPSLMPFSNKKRSEIMQSGKQEAVLSLFTAQTRPARNKHQFKTNDEALKAIQSGHVKLSDEVNVG